MVATGRFFLGASGNLRDGRRGLNRRGVEQSVFLLLLLLRP